MVSTKQHIYNQFMENLPYGMCKFKDGTTELFNRKYKSINCRKIISDKIWFKIIHKYKIPAKRIRLNPPDPKLEMEIWFYDDSCSPWKNLTTRKICEEILGLFKTDIERCDNPCKKKTLSNT